MKIYEIIAEDTRLYEDGVMSKVSSAISRSLTGDSVTLIGRGKVPISSLTPVAKMGVALSRLLKFAALLPLAWQWYGKMAIIDDLVAHDQLSKDDAKVAKRMLAEETIASALFASGVMKIIRGLLSVFGLLRAGLSLLTGTATVLTGGLSIFALAFELAWTTAAYIAIQHWLNSKDGQEFMAKLVMGLIDPFCVEIWNITVGDFLGKAKEISETGKAPVGQVLSATPTLGSVVAGKPSGGPEGTPFSLQSQDAVDDTSADNPNKSKGKGNLTAQARINPYLRPDDADDISGKRVYGKNWGSGRDLYSN